jgi:hypothetical protein
MFSIHFFYFIQIIKQGKMFNTPYRETPGSVTLKSNIPMEYSRAVLTNIWLVHLVIN